jgi:hypothetical protein
MIYETNLFVDYLTKISEARTVASCATTISELERTWKETAWPDLRYYPSIILKGLWKTKKNLAGARIAQETSRIWCQE